jgi:hypothetical protein
MVNVVMLSVNMPDYCYTECHHSICLSTESHYTESY